MEHKHLLIRAEIENPPKDQKAVEEWITKLGEGELCAETTDEGVVSVVISGTNLVSARFWYSDPALLQLDVHAAEINPTDIFDQIERFGVLNKSSLFLDRKENIHQIF